MTKPEKNVLEWIVFAASAALIVAIVATLVIAARGSGDDPPLLTIATGAPTPAGAAFRIPVVVTNDGDTTAAQAQIEVTLMQGGAVIERAEFTIDFLPRKSERGGWVTFLRDPGCCTVTARALGYDEP